MHLYPAETKRGAACNNHHHECRVEHFSACFACDYNGQVRSHSSIANGIAISRPAAGLLSFMLSVARVLAEFAKVLPECCQSVA